MSIFDNMKLNFDSECIKIHDYDLIIAIDEFNIKIKIDVNYSDGFSRFSKLLMPLFEILN